VPVWSHSRLSSFEKCPLQYRYRYIDRIKRDIVGIEGFMGRRVHEALEHLYREVAKGRVPGAGEVVEVYRTRWAAEYDPARVRIVRREFHADDYRATGEICLRDFHAAHAPFADGETLGLEAEVQFALDPSGRYAIKGYIDRLVRAGAGIYEVHDYKTSASIPSENDLRRDRQLTFYQMAVRERYKDAHEVRLVWHFLIHGEERTSSRTEAEVEAHRKQAIRLIDTIEAARDYPARESALCRWCEYRDICPAQQGRLVIEKAAEEAATARAARRRDEAGRATGGSPPAGGVQGSLFGPVQGDAGGGGAPASPRRMSRGSPSPRFPSGPSNDF
jgi:putative RecB family exonuclease